MVGRGGSRCCSGPATGCGQITGGRRNGTSRSRPGSRSGPSPRAGRGDLAMGAPALPGGGNTRHVSVCRRESSGHPKGLEPTVCPGPVVPNVSWLYRGGHTSPLHPSGLGGGERSDVGLWHRVPLRCPQSRHSGHPAAPHSIPQRRKSLFHAPAMGQRDKISPAPAPATGATGLAGSKWSTGSRRG